MPSKPYDADGHIKPLRPGALHYLDTNLFVLPDDLRPQLGTIPRGSAWTTETTRQELIDQFGEQAASTKLAGLNVSTFDDFFRKDPGVCPTFYSYISAMYNPANVGTEEFFQDMYMSRVIKDKVTEADREMYELARKIGSSSHTTDFLGQPKGPGQRHLERLHAQTLKKYKKAARDKHPSYIRDVKSLALALYHALSTRKNAIFYSADADAISLFFKWVDSMVMRMALGYFILPKLGTLDRQHLLGGGSVEIKLDSEEFIKWRIGTMYKACLDRDKKLACRFAIRRWDQNVRAFDEDIYLWFEDAAAHGFLNAHAGHWCYFARNDQMGNWLRYQYFWPPENPADSRLRVVVKRIGLVNVASHPVDCETHDARCKYRKDDASGKLVEWSQFSIPKPKSDS